jgi:hypothetical protein
MTDSPISIQNQIYEIRNHKVILDRDLAALYVVNLYTLNQAARCNISRFPPDFLFQWTQDELDILRSQIVTAKQDKINV